MVDASVSVSSYELCSVDVEGWVLLCAPSPLTLTFFPPLLYSLSSEGRKFDGEISLGLSVLRCRTFCTMSSRGSLDLFPTAQGTVDG